MRIRRDNVPIVAAAAVAIGIFTLTRVVTRIDAARRPQARNGFVMPRPLRRTRPRLRVVEGGLQPPVQAETALVPVETRDPFHALLEKLFHADPEGGSFYALQAGDTPETVARAVLSRVGRFTKQNVIDYIHCVSSSRWNLDRYGSPSTSRTYPRDWLVPGFGKGLRAAFLPRNADALEAIAHGRLPPRTIDPRTGAPLSDLEHLGVLWLPPVDPHALREGRVTCAHQSWSDGSSSIDPPPEFIAFMEAA